MLYSNIPVPPGQQLRQLQLPKFFKGNKIRVGSGEFPCHMAPAMPHLSRLGHCWLCRLQKRSLICWLCIISLGKTHCWAPGITDSSYPCPKLSSQQAYCQTSCKSKIKMAFLDHLYLQNGKLFAFVCCLLCHLIIVAERSRGLKRKLLLQRFLQRHQQGI